jgi:hypothetical protein
VNLDRWNPLRKSVRTSVAWVRRRIRMPKAAPAVWGDAMDEVVHEWQAVHGLDPDSGIRPATFAALA